MHKDNTQSRLFLIRVTFPLILLAVLLSTPELHSFVLGLFLLSLLDVLGGIVQLVWQPRFLDYRFAVARDIAYALTFYLLGLTNPHVSALILAPSVLAELFVMYGYQFFLRAVLIETGLLILRMTIIYYGYHHLHPSWALLIVTASIVMGLLGLEITRLEHLQATTARQQEELKETLTEMLSTILSPNGLNDTFLHQAEISPMLEEICQEANQSAGRKLGEHLAEAIAKQQAAVQLLTSREQEVLELIWMEKSYGQIARHLQVSEGTVRAHAASMMRKATVHSRSELIKWAEERGLLPRNQFSKVAPTAPDPEPIHS